MTNKQLYKNAGSKGAYIDKLREKYPFRICRISEPEFEAVLKGIQPLSDGKKFRFTDFRVVNVAKTHSKQG